ncbi:sigma-54 interaction domain-containing protein [Desulfofundulus thermobenzoicus]|nr:sigma 54-interacting transcriptional regulator [Desulfofundulus thermobenzoicus]
MNNLLAKIPLNNGLVLNQNIDTSYSQCSGIYLTDGNAITMGIDKHYQELTNILEEEVKGRHMKELEDDGYFDRSVSLLVLKYKTRVTIEQKVLRSGKKIIVTGNPIFDKDGNIVMIATTVFPLGYTAQPSQRINSINNAIPELHGMVAASQAMQQVLVRAIRAAALDSTVLIMGESGVGKEVVAKIIHLNSNRRTSSFIKVNIASIPEELFESELFGYRCGAFTGASKEGKRGLVQAADGGTLFLDEIGEVPLGSQAKLLRLLQEKEVLPLGSVITEQVDVRFIAATNRNLPEMVKEEKFREDLFYRLNVMPIYIPPLRERPEDICALLQHFLTYYCQRYRVQKQLTPGALETLMGYEWPGNIRELQNLIERLVVLYPDQEITSEHIFDELSLKGPYNFLNNGSKRSVAMQNLDLTNIVADFEKDILLKTLKQYGNNMEKAAQALGIHRTTLMRKLRKYRLKS